MAETRHKYVLRFEAQGGKVVGVELQKMGADGEKSFKRLEAGANRVDQRFNLLARTVLTRLVPALSAGVAVRSILENVQAFEKLDNRLKFLTSSAAQYGKAQDFLRETSRALHVDILELSDGYARLLALQKGGTLVGGDVERLLIGLTNAKAALGANDAQLGLAIYGLSQALSQGAVQAQEFNQVIEPLPGLMQAMDKAAGLSAGGFRALVKDGEVTADFFRDTLIKALQEYEGAAANMAGTATAAFTDLQNAWKELSRSVGESGLIDGLADATSGTALFIDQIAQAAQGSQDFSDALKNLTQAMTDYRAAQKLPFSPYSAAEFIQDPEGSRARERLDEVEARIADLRARKARPAAGLRGLLRRADQLFEDKELSRLLAERGDLAERVRLADTAARRAKGDVYGPFRPAGPAPTGTGGNAGDVDPKAIEKVIDALTHRNEQMMRSNEQQELYNELRRAGVELSSAEGQEIAALVGRYQEFNRAQDAQRRAAERTKQQWDEKRESAERLGGAINDLVSNYDNLGDAARHALGDFAESLIAIGSGGEATGGIGGLLAGVAGSAIFGFGGGSKGKVIYDYPAGPYRPNLPGRASGGSVMPGQSYWVGERGPEILTMGSQGGHITPNSAAAGGGTYYIDARGADREGLARVENMIKALNGKVERVKSSIAPVAVGAVQDKFRRSNSFMR